MVGIDEQAEQKIRTLSGGQRRRLDVAVGIIGRPEVLFLDEPTAGFDPAAKREFHGLVGRLAALEDTTILLTTHDLDEAEKLADRILILAGGRIVADGTSGELAATVPRDAQVAWTSGGERHRETTPDATAFVKDLIDRLGTDVLDLEVRRPTLEDTYLALVQAHESGRPESALAAFGEEDP